MEEVIEVKILGKVIGVATGWDESGDTSIQYYDYVGYVSELMETSCFSFNWGSGEFELHDDDGNVTSKHGYEIIM